MDPIRCQTLGLGVTVDEEEACVLISTGTEEQPIVVVLTPEAGFQIGTALMALSTEASILQGQIEKMTPEELAEYLETVRLRNARGFN